MLMLGIESWIMEKAIYRLKTALALLSVALGVLCIF